MADEIESGEQVAAPRKRLSGRARLILLVIGAAVLVGGLVWFIQYRTTGRYMQETNDAYIAADLVTVSPKVPGYVSAVLVAENADVRPGQALVRIDPRDTQASAQQAQAQVEVGLAQAGAARAQVAEQQAGIAQARAEVAAAQVRAQHDAAEVARYRPLVATGAETGERLAQLELAARQSAAELAARRAALAQAQRRTATIGAQVRQGEAQADAARAQLAAANVDLGATTIAATTAGRVGDRTVTVGQYVQPGTRLMSIVPLDQIYVTANFKETQLALMRPGQPVTIEIDALDGLEIEGRVDSFSPGTGAQFSLLPPENATGNFTKITQRVPVRIALRASPQVRRLLVPGLSVVVTVDTRSARDELDRLRASQGR